MNEKRHPPGTVGVAVQETGRYTAFTESMSSLQTPTGTQILWRYGSHIVNGMNWLVDNMAGQWLWIMGDDHSFDPHMLLRLLDHNVDVVVPVCLMRQQPFAPVVRVNDEGNVIDLTKLKPSEGLIEIHSAGSGGMLVRKRVFDRVREAFPGRVFVEDGDVSEDFLFCFAPEVIVEGEGGANPISLIEIGDVVVTHTGSSKRVRDTNVRDYEGPLVSIRPAYNDALRVTPNHRLLVMQDGVVGWIEASKIRVGDRLCTPKIHGSSSAVSWKIEDHVSGVTVGEDGLVGYSRTRKTALRIPTSLEVDIELARLLGYFIAEGSISKPQHSVRLNFGSHYPEYIEDAVSIFRSRFGVVPTMTTHNGCTIVEVCSSVLARMFTSLCDGRLSWTKRLPEGWRNFENEILTELIKGYWRGDGHCSARGLFGMTTSSPRLAEDLRSALLRLGIYAGVRFRENGTRGRYDIRVPASETTKFGSLIGESTDFHDHKKKEGSDFVTQDESFYYVRVASVAEHRYSGQVFNLTVEEDESYTVNGFAAHNCSRVREIGIPIHCDLGSRLGHMAVVGIWPGVGPDGHFCIDFQVADLSVKVALPE